jgi:hypothetical protein
MRSVNSQRASTQQHLLECYLFLHDFRIESSSNQGDLTLRRKADSREFRLKVDIEWLQLKTAITVEHRLNALGLIAFLLRNGAARIGLTVTGQEVLSRFEQKFETDFLSHVQHPPE